MQFKGNIRLQAACWANGTTSDLNNKDGRTDGQGDTSIPPINFVEAGGIIIATARSHQVQSFTWYLLHHQSFGNFQEISIIYTFQKCVRLVQNSLLSHHNFNDPVQNLHLLKPLRLRPPNPTPIPQPAMWHQKYKCSERHDAPESYISLLF